MRRNPFDSPPLGSYWLPIDTYYYLLPFLSYLAEPQNDSVRPFDPDSMTIPELERTPKACAFASRSSLGRLEHWNFPLSSSHQLTNSRDARASLGVPRQMPPMQWPPIDFCICDVQQRSKRLASPSMLSSCATTVHLLFYISL